MNTLIPIVLIVIVAVLIFKSIGKSDPAAQACAKEIVQFLKGKHDANAEEIAAILKSHNRTETDVGQVTVIVKSRLNQTGIAKEKHDDVMRRLREAKSMLN